MQAKSGFKEQYRAKERKRLKVEFAVCKLQIEIWKIFVPIMVLLLSNPAGAVELTEQDKVLHMAGSAAITVGTYGAMRALGKSKKKSIIIASVTAIGVGIVKELVDEKVDHEDLEADAVGIFLAMPLITW